MKPILIESEVMSAARSRYATDPVVQSMAMDVAEVPPSALVHDDGTVRIEFALAAIREYERRTGTYPECHIGGIAEAIMLILYGEQDITQAAS